MLEEKNWSKESEKKIYDVWKESKRYKFNKDSKKKVYSIDTPPPYVNTPIHIGQATTYVLMDMFARYKRMQGHEVLFPLGLDRNGLPIEMAAEKKFNIQLIKTNREDFIEFCHKVLEESSMASVESFLRLGIGFNSWDKGTEIGDIYETDSPEYRALTQRTFIDLWHNGLVYEDDRVNNWCPGCQTTIADAEIDYAELSSFFNDIKFKVQETGEDIIIGTTRPELICTCEMICYNPLDERYASLEGKHAVTPIFNKIVPIKPDPVAQMDKGTGLMMMCSFGDVTDIRFFRDNGLKPTIAINKDGVMNENAGFLKGLKTKEAQKTLVEELNKQGLLVKQQKIKHRTPICERSKDPIEFIGMKEFYLKQIDFIEEMRKIAQKPRFFAEESRKILLDWINSVSIDWPISRRRYYATEIPLWYCNNCNEPYVPSKDGTLVKGTTINTWNKIDGIDRIDDSKTNYVAGVSKYYMPWKEDPPIDKCPLCGNSKKIGSDGTEIKAFRGEERVFDTWFDSSISPLYILKYDMDKEFFKKNSSCSLRPQGKEIIRTWLYYTLLKDYLLTGNCIFDDVWINYHIVDDSGKKMSKSVGNIIDPKNILDKYGAEPFRLWASFEGNLERQDFRCSLERIEGAGKTISKLWNVAKFILLFKNTKTRVDVEPHLTTLDKWILNELNYLIIESTDCYENYDFHNSVIKVRHFIWETFSSHYVELVKNRAYNQNKDFTLDQQNAAIYVLNYVLEVLMKLLAPVIPMITYRIYDELCGKDIHFEAFPTPGKEYIVEISKDDVVDINSFIWKSKKDAGKSLKEEIVHLTIPEKFKEIQHDLISAHNVKKLSFGEKKVELSNI